ncbi:DUF167 domain-containing protein [Candidatus Kaiserbacteria bacterium]|nr:DUF167 domain-containing protein [Candidatus Kaiserbacteria bacterium]
MSARIIKIRATTDAKKETVRVISPDTLAVSVKEKPEHNLANERIVELVALHFNIPVKKVRFLKGRRSPSKTFLVDIP